MAKYQISKSTLTFLNNLKKNNNRPWFNENKDKYLAAYEDAQRFGEALLHELSKHDQLVQVTGKEMLMRIYRDTRFSNDKTPYKTHFAGGFKRDTKLLRGGYYFSISPGNSVIAGGFWGPNSADLKRIREGISRHATPLRKAIAAKRFKETFGALYGEEVKTAPKGFAKDHPEIDLIRKKQFLVKREFTDREILSPEYTKEAVKTFKAMRPFFDYMSEVLTTDANGEIIV